MKNMFNFIILFTFLIGGCISTSGCDKNSAGNDGNGTGDLKLLFETTLNISEPSGVAYFKPMHALWVVSGGDQHIYMLDTSGAILQKLPFTGTDLEGIVFDTRDSTLWVVDEATLAVSHLNLQGTLLKQFYLPYQPQSSNKGPEGITIGENNKICIINERDPSIFVTLNDQFASESIVTINFALDYSDIYYVSSDTYLVLSDESSAVYLWSVSKGVFKKYPLSNVKNEGVAFDQTNSLMYIVNDETAKLYCYRVDNFVVN